MIRLRTTVIPTLVFLTLSTTTTLHAQVRMRSGMWENKTTAHGKTGTISKCLKPADVAMLNSGSSAMLRAEMEKATSKSGCTLKNFKLDGNTLTYTMVCSESTVLVETKFHGGDSVEDTNTFTVGGVTNVYQIKKRRTGDCKAGQ